MTELRTSGGPYFSVTEAAAVYGVDGAQLRKWLYRGRVLRGPDRTVDVASLEHYLTTRGTFGQHTPPEN